MSTPLMFRNHFQLAYVVRNIDNAVARMKDVYGVPNWQVMRIEDSPLGVGALGLAYVQHVMIELIEPVEGLDTIYRDWVPESDSAARFHHMGYLFESEEEFRLVVGQFEAAGIRAASAGSFGGIVDFHFADTVAQLGHFCELIHFRAAGRGFFSQVPHN